VKSSLTLLHQKPRGEIAVCQTTTRPALRGYALRDYKVVLKGRGMLSSCWCGDPSVSTRVTLPNAEPIKQRSLNLGHNCRFVEGEWYRLPTRSPCFLILERKNSWTAVEEVVGHKTKGSNKRYVLLKGNNPCARGGGHTLPVETKD
jgi:hypothetical protein